MTGYPCFLTKDRYSKYGRIGVDLRSALAEGTREECGSQGDNESLLIGEILTISGKLSLLKERFRRTDGG